MPQLIDSQSDDIALCTMVEAKFRELCDLYKRVTDNNLTFPEHLKFDVIRWRTMRIRHRRGDFRHSFAELLSTRSVAEWTLELNAELRNQPKPKKMEWR